MSVQSELTRLEEAKAAIIAAIQGKEVEVPEGTKFDGLAALVESIEVGGYTIEQGSITFDSDINVFPASLALKDGVLPSILLVYLPSLLNSSDVTLARTLGLSIVLLYDTICTYASKAHEGITAAAVAFSASNVRVPDFANSVQVSLRGDVRMWNLPYTLATAGMTYEYLAMWGAPLPNAK